jgi:hypothetical protein
VVRGGRWDYRWEKVKLKEICSEVNLATYVYVVELEFKNQLGISTILVTPSWPSH